MHLRSFVMCMHACRVLGAYLSLVDILIEDDVALVLQRMSPEDTHVLMTLVCGLGFRVYGLGFWV